ncbi:hypothetical protein SESBI_04965 [Sesbania bispinosa]|nr:hypothetical protein SESBI_04965 [Sesbania bispinosa]
MVITFPSSVAMRVCMCLSHPEFVIVVAIDELLGAPPDVVLKWHNKLAMLCLAMARKLIFNNSIDKKFCI